MFFKTSNPAALLAWDQFMADCLKLREEARHLDKVLGCGCRSVFSTGIGGRYFHGVNFPGNERPFSRELWTVQRPASGNSCRPRTSRIIGHIDNIPAPELESRWPRSVVDLIDVLENELKRQNVSNPRELARKQAVALSCFLGGRQFYIPCGDTILTALRDDLLYCQFNGRNMEELRRQYRLSQPQIYQIIARQRKLHTRRHQPDLFSPESPK